MMSRIRSAIAERDTSDKGFTLIELLVVVIIIGILAAIAIPVFMNQKAKAYDASVKSDLKTFATNAETFATDPTTADTYGNAVADVTKVFGTTQSKGNEFKLYVYSDGYILYGQNQNSKNVFFLSSYNGSAPTPSSLNGAAGAVAALSGSTIPVESPVNAPSGTAKYAPLYKFTGTAGAWS